MKLEGILPALLTPYNLAGEISEDMLCDLVDLHIEVGVNGLYICGGSGEGLLLKTLERKRVAEVVVNQTHGRVPVIVHVGSITTEEAIDLACHAQRIGADAISSVPPFFYAVSVDGVYRHYARIAENCELPMLVYNIPSAVNVSVTPKIMAKLINIPSVMGIKFSSYNLFELWQMCELDHRLNVLSGNDEVFLGALAMGAQGAIGLTLNFMPKLYRGIFDSFRSGQWHQARELQSYAGRVIRVLLQYPVVPAMKEIMRLKGYDCGHCRGPLEILIEQQRHELHDGLMNLGFFDQELGL